MVPLHYEYNSKITDRIYFKHIFSLIIIIRSKEIFSIQKMNKYIHFNNFSFIQMKYFIREFICYRKSLPCKNMYIQVHIFEFSTSRSALKWRFRELVKR